MSAITEATEQLTAELKKRREEAGDKPRPMTGEEKAALAQLLSEIYLAGIQALERFSLTYR